MIKLSASVIIINLYNLGKCTEIQSLIIRGDPCDL